MQTQTPEQRKTAIEAEAECKRVVQALLDPSRLGPVETFTEVVRPKKGKK